MNATVDEILAILGAKEVENQKLRVSLIQAEQKADRLGKQLEELQKEIDALRGAAAKPND